MTVQKHILHPTIPQLGSCMPGAGSGAGSAACGGLRPTIEPHEDHMIDKGISMWSTYIAVANLVLDLVVA